MDQWNGDDVGQMRIRRANHESRKEMREAWGQGETKVVQSSYRFTSWGSLHIPGGLFALTRSNSICPQESCTNTASRDRKSTRLNSSHIQKSRMPSSA